MPYKFTDGKTLDHPICSLCRNVNGELYKWPDGVIRHWSCLSRLQDGELLDKQYPWLGSDTIEMLLYEYEEDMDTVKEALDAKYAVIWSTDEHEASIKGFDSLKEATDAIEETEGENSEWGLYGLYHNGKRLQVKFNKLVVVEDV